MNKRKCIGILGGGQLARMSALQAYKLGFSVAILEKIKTSPAGQLTHNEFVGWVNNKKVLQKFAEASDVITLENEFIDHSYLRIIESMGKNVFPSSKTISLIQDKFIQKRTFEKNNLPVPKYLQLTNNSTYKTISEKLGQKFLLKSRKMGYDGYGNFTVKSEKDFAEGISKLQSRHSHLMAEKFIDFKMELAVMIVRSKKEIKTYPVVQTIQKNHICHTVIAPAKINKRQSKLVEEIGIEAVKSVGGYGIFGIELFLNGSNQIYINEMAPRTHNSGHYTMEGCVTSQFENHVRVVLGLPLGATELVKPCAVMVNLLGKRKGLGIIDNYTEAMANENVHVHVYGKEQSRPGRKMGHITLLGNNVKSTLQKARNIEKKILI